MLILNHHPFKSFTYLFNKMVIIFKDNMEHIKNGRRQRFDLKYNYTNIILGAFNILYFQNPS